MKIYSLIRRIQDIFFSLLAFVFLLPLLLIIAVVIYLDDPHGSPVFKQKRCGKNGRIFQLYKFRTMQVGAEEKLEQLIEYNECDGPVFKIKNDPRITRAGLFLRKTGLDELPQLVNIFVGDMSFVGPRPALPREVEMYNEYQRQRLQIKPGLTCYWQTMPHRNDIPFDEWVELDLKYLRERSFFVDWKIILSTVSAVWQAYGE